MTHSWHLVSAEDISHSLKSASPGDPSALAFQVNTTVLLLAISQRQPQYGFWSPTENWFRSSADLTKSGVMEIDFFGGAGDTNQLRRFMIRDKRYLLAVMSRPTHPQPHCSVIYPSTKKDSTHDWTFPRHIQPRGDSKLEKGEGWLQNRFSIRGGTREILPQKHTPRSSFQATTACVSNVRLK